MATLSSEIEAQTENISGYERNFPGSLSDRTIGRILTAERLTNTSPVKLTITLIVLHTVLMMACVQLGIWSQHNDPGRYFREGRIVTWLSTFQLMAVAYICGAIWNVCSRSEGFTWKDPAAIWKFASYSFYFFALDEILKIHEALDRYSHKIAGVAITDASDHLDDLIVGVYALAGIIALIYCWLELVRYIGCAGYAIGAFIASFVSIYLDYLSADRAGLKEMISYTADVEFYMTWLGLAEEFFKIYAEVFFIATAIYCFQKSLTLLSGNKSKI